MPATTIGVDVNDKPDGVTITTGGTPGSKGVTIIIDASKFTTEAQVRTALTRAANRISDKWPLPSS